MPRARRQKSPNHIVFVDTNILWHENKKHTVNPDFSKFWSDNKDLVNLKLYIPEVVLGELKFLHFHKASRALRIANEEIENINKICNKDTCRPLKESKIKNNVHKKIDDWCSANEATTIETPIEEIDWQEIIHLSLERKIPFSFDKNNNNNEKGFRDAMIAKTFIHFCKANKERNTNYVLLCNDKHLKNYCDSSLKSNSKVLFIETLEEFSSYIRLTQEQLTNKFVKSIQSHAQEKFFSSKNDNHLYNEVDLYQKIVEKYNDEIEKDFPRQNQNTFDTILGGLNNRETWRRVRHRPIIVSTQFDKLDGENEFYWKSRVNIAQLFERKNNLDNELTETDRQKKIRLVMFDIYWKAEVRKDGRFYNKDLTNINFVSTNLLEANSENLTYWSLK